MGEVGPDPWLVVLNGLLLDGPFLMLTVLLLLTVFLLSTVLVMV
jgi:hypothetical protein